MMRQHLIRDLLALLTLIGMTGAPLAAQEISLPLPNTLPSLDQQTSVGPIEVIQRVSCVLKVPLTVKSYAVTWKDGDKTVTKKLLTMAADRCKYVYDNEKRVHQVLLDLSLDIRPVADIVAKCPVLTTALLIRSGTTVAEMSWPGKTVVLSKTKLTSPQTPGESLYSMANINLAALQSAVNQQPNSFVGYLSAKLVVLSEAAENWAKSGTFAYALAAAHPFSDDGLLIPNTPTVDPEAPKTLPAVQAIPIEVEVLSMRIACTKADGKLVPNVIVVEAT
jgi:hypothetical protein